MQVLGHLIFFSFGIALSLALSAKELRALESSIVAHPDNTNEGNEGEGDLVLNGEIVTTCEFEQCFSVGT